VILRLIYILDRFPSYTLNFIYNEIDVLEREGLVIDIYSLRPAQNCPEEASRFLPRTTNVRPAPAGAVLRAWIHYLRRRPRALLALLFQLPLDNHGPGTGLRALAHLAVAVYFAWLVRDRREHLHAHFAAKSALTALVVSRLNGNSYSFTAHGSSTVFPPKRISLASKIRGADFVVAVSEYNRSTIATLCPELPGEHIVVNRSGIRLEQFPFRKPADRSDAPFRLICIASLHSYKNHETVIEACRLLAERELDFRLDCLGGDVSGRRDKLVGLASQSGVADRVRFRGHVDHGEILDSLQGADLVVLASRVEGVPVSLMEAMAVGTPVLGPHITGLAELIEDGDCGYLADPERPEEFAEKAARLLREPGMARQMASRARARIEAEYDMQSNARSLAAEFKTRLDVRSRDRESYSGSASDRE